VAVWEITIVVDVESDAAQGLFDTLTETACRCTGGRGDGEDHICAGFVCASIVEAASDCDL
jgi:hypothetical protein